MSLQDPVNLAEVRRKIRAIQKAKFDKRVDAEIERQIIEASKAQGIPSRAKKIKAKVQNEDIRRILAGLMNHI